jgi:hypothetical protein
MNKLGKIWFFLVMAVATLSFFTPEGAAGLEDKVEFIAYGYPQSASDFSFSAVIRVTISPAS